MAEGVRRLHSMGCPAKSGGRCHCAASWEAKPARFRNSTREGGGLGERLLALRQLGRRYLLSLAIDHEHSHRLHPAEHLIAGALGLARGGQVAL